MAPFQTSRSTAFLSEDHVYILVFNVWYNKSAWEVWVDTAQVAGGTNLIIREIFRISRESDVPVVNNLHVV